MCFNIQVLHSFGSFLIAGMSPASVSTNIFSRVVVFSFVRGFKYSEVVSRHGPISQRQVSTQSRHLAWDTTFSFWHDGRHDFGPAKRKFVDYLNHYFLHVFLGHNAWWFTYPSHTWSGRFDKRATRGPNEKTSNRRSHKNNRRTMTRRQAAGMRTDPMGWAESKHDKYAKNQQQNHNKCLWSRCVYGQNELD